MQKNQKKTVIGFFVVCAFALAIMTVVILGGGRLFRSEVNYRIYFTKTVDGLNVGAPVMFQGVKIGQVSKIRLIPDRDAEKNDQDETDTPSEGRWTTEVVIGISPESLGASDQSLLSSDEEYVRNLFDTMIMKEGLRAGLRTMSFITGQLGVTLDYVKDDLKEDVLTRRVRNKIIPTYFSSMDKLIMSLTSPEFEKMIQTFAKGISDISVFVNDGKLTKVMNNVADISENVQGMTSKMDKELPGVIADFKNVAERLQAALTEVTACMSRMEAKTDGAIGSIKQTFDEADLLLQEGRPLLTENLQKLSGCISDVNKLASEAKGVLHELDRRLSSGSPLEHQLLETLRTCETMLSELSSLTNQVENDPQILIWGK